MKLTYAKSPYFEPATVKEPQRGSPHAAGLDVYVPLPSDRFSHEFDDMNDPSDYNNAALNATRDSIHVPPHGKVLIPTGLHFNIPEGTYLEVANRGSVASKLGLIYGAHIIDSDYMGEVFINLHNLSEEAVEIKCGQKIAQLLHKEVLMSSLSEMDFLDLYPKQTARGDGKLGSTGHA